LSRYVLPISIRVSNGRNRTPVSAGCYGRPNSVENFEQPPLTEQTTSVPPTTTTEQLLLLLWFTFFIPNREYDHWAENLTTSSSSMSDFYHFNIMTQIHRTVLTFFDMKVHLPTIIVFWFTVVQWVRASVIKNCGDVCWPSTPSSLRSPIRLEDCWWENLRISRAAIRAKLIRPNQTIYPW